MTVNMPHNGSSYYKLIQKFSEELFVAEKRRIDKSIGNLIQANNEAKVIDCTGFTYMGEWYTSSQYKQIGRPSLRPSLEEFLVPRMEQHLKSSAKIVQDKKLIEQALYMALAPCENLQAMRDTLPDSVAEYIPALNKLPRMGEVGCSLKEHTHQYDQYMEMVPKMEFYSATRLIY